MNGYEKTNTKEMQNVREFMLERMDNCKSLKREAIVQMVLWFWWPSKFKRAKALYLDAKQAYLIYQSGVDVLNQHKGMRVTSIR